MKKISLISLLFFTLVLHIACAQVTSRDLLCKKYSLRQLTALLIPRQQWKPFPVKSQEWKNALGDSLCQSIVDAAAHSLLYVFPSISAITTLEYVRNGNRSHYEAISFEKRKKLFLFMLAEAIEDKGRFTDKILEGVWNICEETYWGVPAHLGAQKSGSGLPDVNDPIVDLFGAETAALLALTDYFAGEKLDKISPLIRPRIYHEVNRKILIPLEKESNRYGWLGAGRRDVRVNNWDPWIMSNFITANLLLEKDEQRRASQLYHAMSFLDLYINGLGNDGATDEGPAYWSAAGGCLFDALNLIGSATSNAVNIYSDPVIRNMASYIYQTHIAGHYFIDVADADATIHPDALLIYRMGKWMQDEKLKDFGTSIFHTQQASLFGSSFFNPRKLYNLLVYREVKQQQADWKGVNDVWYPSVQLMAARSAKGWYVASHGGHNAESHNHNDVGDLIVYADGHPILIDVGRGTYTAKTFSASRYQIWYNTSPYHNLPAIDGMGQGAGRQYEATDVLYRADPQKVTFRLNIAKAYPKETHLTAWIRTVQLDREKEILEIKDAYIANAPLQQLQQSFMTVCDTHIDQPGVILFQVPDGKSVQLLYDKRRWRVTKEEMKLTTPEDQGIGPNWQGRTVWRILLINDSPRQKDRLLYTLKK